MRYAARGVAFLLRVSAFTALAFGIPSIFSHTARDVLLPLLWNKIAPGALVVIFATAPSGFVASWTFAMLRKRTDVARGIAGVAGTYTFIVLTAVAVMVIEGGAPPVAEVDVPWLIGAAAQAGIVGAIFGFRTRFAGDDANETAPAPSPPSAELPTPEAKQ